MDVVSPSSAVPSRDTMQGAVSMAASAAEDSAPPAAGGAGEATSSAGRHGETASGASSGSVKKRSDYLVSITRHSMYALRLLRSMITRRS